MTTRIVRVSKFCRPPLQQRGVSKLSAEGIREAILRAWEERDDERESLPPASRSRLSPEQRAEMLAEAEKGYERLRSDPEELADEIAEGDLLDDTLTDPVIEE